MPITNELLDTCPINCGNCLHMKQKYIKWKGRRRKVARCAEDIISVGDSGWFIDMEHNVLPRPWVRAETCPAFDGMALGV